MYRNLWTNGPKEDLEFPDYPCETHWGGVTTSYPPREALRDYLKGYLDFHGVDLNQINFNHLVKEVSFSDDLFSVHVYDAKNEKDLYKTFD
jgi:trimethylamine monooxygenase